MIKSAINYTGGKYKLLPALLDLFPDNINEFVDLFGGAFNVGVNIEANTIYYNELNSQLYELISNMSEFKISEIEYLIKEWNLDNVNKESYISFRKHYNSNRNPINLYILMCHSFSNIMRFNSKGDFNAPFGQRTFNDSMKNNFIKFTEFLKSKNIKYSNVDFRTFPVLKNAFYYIDPPYRISTATYNENNGWSLDDDLDLMNYCDKLNSSGIKFAMSNVFENKGLVNNELMEWSKKYNVIYIENSYNSCNYQRKNKDKPTIEVLITNY